MDTQPVPPPWEHIDPALTADRLMAIATIIVRETDAKIVVRDPRDWNWNIACDCHAWVVEGIHAAAEGECKDWLFPTSLRRELDLKFSIGGASGIAAKIYRPDSSGQPQRTLRQANEIFRVIQEALGEDLAPDPEPEIRFATDKDEDGRVTMVRLVQLSLEGAMLYHWPIWTSDSSAKPIENAPQPEAVELEEPRVELPEDEERERRERENPNDTQAGD